MGGHFNPRNMRHGSPHENGERHVGDLGNVSADELGRAQFKFSDKIREIAATLCLLCAGSSCATIAKQTIFKNFRILPIQQKEN